jgi:Glycosyl transferases group 1
LQIVCTNQEAAIVELRDVLIIAYYFPPMGLSGVQRTLKFVKYLPDYGWRPIILTTGDIPFYAFDETLLKELEDKDIKIYRTPEKNPKKNKSKARKFPSRFVQRLGGAVLQTLYQPDSKVKWKSAALELADKIIEENNISAVFSTAPPYTDFLIAEEIRKKYQLPYVVDYRDSWVDNEFNFYATPFHKLYSIGLERNILNKANKAFVITRHTKEKIISRYRMLSHDDVMILPHGYDKDDFEVHRNVKPDPKKFVITHSGVFQDSRTPKYFLEAVAKFIENNKEAREKLQLRFVGVMRKNHLKLIKKFGLKHNTILTGYLNHSDSVRNLMESDLLWLMQFDNVRSPGKLYEYFGARKPILACLPEGEMRQLALESKAAIATDPKNVTEIRNALNSCFKLWKTGNLPKPNEEFVQKYDRQKLTGILSRELGLAAEY